MKIDFNLLITLLVIVIPTLLVVCMMIVIIQKYLIKYKIKFESAYKKKQKEKEDKEKEKELERDAYVRPGNPVLENLYTKHNVIFYGGLGCGKTLVANLLAKYIEDKNADNDYKYRRQLKYTNPGYLADRERLAEERKLNVYSQISLEDPVTGYTNQDLWSVLTQRKRAVENGVYLADEIGEKFGKDTRFEQTGKSRTYDYAMAEESVRFARQDANIKFIGTEQAEDNIWKPIRDKGFLGVKMHGVKTWITTKGKVLQKLKNILLLVLPGIITLNSREVISCQFGKKNKWKSFAILLLPAYFTPKQYYIKKIKIAKKIKFRYTIFKAYMEYNKELHYLIFTNNDIFKYNTRGHKEEYLKKFDADGNNRYVGGAT